MGVPSCAFIHVPLVAQVANLGVGLFPTFMQKFGPLPVEVSALRNQRQCALAGSEESPSNCCTDAMHWVSRNLYIKL